MKSTQTATLSSTEPSPKIDYPLLSYGIKIESLTPEQQQKIDEYVFDCQNIFTATYTQLLDSWNYDRLGEPYISFTDTFAYDFSKINESNLDKSNAQIWNSIKTLSDDSAPIMYIELSGFSNFWGNAYKPTSFIENPTIYGYFIFENETVVPMLYRNICNAFYIYEMPKGTEVINCGNKYSGEKNMEELAELYQVIQDGTLPNDMLKRLTLLK